MQTNRAVCCVATRCHDMFDFWRATVSQDLWMLKSLQLRSLLLWTLSCSTTGPAWRTHRKPITSLVFIEKFQVVKLNMIVVFPKVLWTKKAEETYKNVSSFCLFFLASNLSIWSSRITKSLWTIKLRGLDTWPWRTAGWTVDTWNLLAPHPQARRWCPDGMMISWIIFGLV